MIRRTEVAQTDMLLAAQSLHDRSDGARFANTRLAGDQHDLAVSSLRARPSAQQQVDFLIAADQRAHHRFVQRVEPAGDGARTQHLPYRHRLADSLDLSGAKVT